jgi:imidazoleglycerol phosphate dehydratase HisB
VDIGQPHHVIEDVEKVVGGNVVRALGDVRV